MQTKNNENWKYRWAPSLGGGFAGTPEKVWGVKKYNPEKHMNENVVFCGLYGLPDFYALWRHKGRKVVWWCGSDVAHFRAGYWLDNNGEIAFEWMGGRKSEKNKLPPNGMARWINKYCENYVENEGEAWQLNDCGIEVDGIIPSFLGDAEDYKVSFKQGNKVYSTAHEGNQDYYGWGIISQVACALPEIEFHVYGASWPYQPMKNVIVHGKVPQKKMDKEIRGMQCGLRLNKHDGFSEITAKSVLWGQYPITYLYFPYVSQYAKDDCGWPYCVNGLNNLVELLRQIPFKKKPNIKARSWYIKHLNKYPWNHAK